MTGDSGSEESALARLPTPGIVSPQNLAPLSNDLPPEVRIFTETLRGLFGALGLSLTRFSAEMYCDKGTVSRYLSGERIPPPDFIEKLLRTFYDRRGAPVTSEIQQLVDTQHLAALQARNPAQYELQKLTGDLRRALEEKKRCEIQITALEEAVVLRQGRIYQLEMERRGIQEAWTAEQERGEESRVEDQNYIYQLEQTVQKLREEIVQLRGQVRRAQERARNAEQRCQGLEEKLDEASANAEESEGSRPDSPRRMQAREAVSRLTPRQKEVLKLVGEGMTRREIAEFLLLSEFTVKDHLLNISKRLDIPETRGKPINLTRMALLARDAGLET